MQPRSGLSGAPRARSRGAAAALPLIASFAMGCGAAGPLLHPAHVLTPGKVSVGAGMAGQVAALRRAQPEGEDKTAPVLEEYAVAPGLAPWAAGRVGIDGDNEAGITYAGRAFRVDFRHAFGFDPIYLSLGAGGSALVPRQKRGGDDLGSAYGGGADVPILIGYKSTAELYSLWAGPRVGFEILTGSILESEVVEGGRTDAFLPFSARHVYVGGLVGAKVGFRSFHVGLELDVLYHLGDGEVGQNGEREGTLGQLTIAPGSALILTL